MKTKTWTSETFICCKGAKCKPTCRMTKVTSLSTGDAFQMKHAKDCECKEGHGGDRKTGMLHKSDGSMSDGKETTASNTF